MSPVSGTNVGSSFTVAATAKPGSTVHVNLSYTNRLTGVLNLSGTVLDKDYTADANGNVNLGRIELGSLYSANLTFTLTMNYPDSTTAAVSRFVANKISRKK
ncbi:MAG: hypothetical protein J6U98_02310 [Abditibacteriota bacterium]|nr:hypothetical protein [Abditibacteriota bacterium]